jgi:hypothetical protein
MEGERSLHLGEAPAAWLLCSLYLMDKEGGGAAQQDLQALESEALGNTLRYASSVWAFT